MYRSFSITMLVLVMLPCALKAQDTVLADLPAKWRLEDCIEYAKKKNISLATLKLSTILAHEDLLQSKAAVLPNLTGAISQNLVNSNNANPVVGGFQTQSTFSGNYSLNSGMTIYNGGFLRNDIRSKELAVQSANLNVQETENSLTLSITQAFFNILLAKETMASLAAVLSTSQGQLEQGQQRFDAGSIARKDLLQLQSQVATDQYNLTNATNNFKLNTVILKQYLLLPSSYDFIVSAPDSIPIPPPVTPLPEAQEEAQTSRPEVRNKELQIEISQVELQKVKSGVKPNVGLGAALASGYSNNQSSEFVQQLDDNFYQSLGISIAIPIYSRRVNKTNINKSKIELEQSKLALLDTKNVLDHQVEQTYISLLNAQAQFAAAKVSLTTSEEIYHITNEQLKMGSVNTFELLHEKNAYVQALQAFTQAKYTVALYNKIYEFYRGIPITY